MVVYTSGEGKVTEYSLVHFVKGFLRYSFPGFLRLMYSPRQTIQRVFLIAQHA